MTPIIPIFIVIFSIFFLIYFEIKRECTNCKIKEIYIYTSKINKDYKFLYVADFHNSKNECVKKQLKNILKKDSDINDIISGGDMITYSPIRRTGIRYNNFLDLLDIIIKNNKKFYYGYGNHENRFGIIREKFPVDNSELVKFNNDIKDYKINYLTKSQSLKDNINLYEIRLPFEYYKKKLYYKNISKLLDDKTIENYVGKINKGNYNIIVCHNPSFAENLINYGFDLVLSGHFHGGLIRLPFIGAFITPEATFFHPYNKGLYEYKNGNVLVSNGLGEHTIKIRLNNIPEIYKVYIKKR